jgi:anti-sigma factor RsiW
MPAARPGGGPLEQSQQLSHRVAMVRKRQQVTEAGVDPSPPVALRIEVAGFASGLCCGDVAVLLDAEQHTLLVRVEQQRPARAEGTPAVVAATACHRIPLPAGVDVYVVGARARLKSKAGQLVVRLPLL